MKHFVYILVALLLSSCNKNDLYYENSDSNNITVQFNVDIQEEVQVSRAVNETLISNLYLLVFDENARFISRHQASMSGNNFTATLPQSSNKRIVHFVANYNWSSFSDTQAVTKDEGEIIAPLQSTDLIFWQRMVLNSGISANVFSSQPVSLIRNMAKFTLENKPTSGLTNAQFALYNVASTGSVAPFNTTNRSFDPIITEPVGVTFTGSTTLSVADIYTFERKNSTVTTDPTFVIVQGTYAGATSYYKVDIINSTKDMYDIQRNTWFKIVVESVSMAGYSTIDTAKNSPASNNIFASVVLQSYPTVSDGSYVLSVNKTVVTFTTSGQTLKANTTYKTVAGVFQNSSIVITLIQDTNFPVINGAVAYDAATGNLTAAINNVPQDGATYTATIKIMAGNLSKTIKVIIHAPFKFTNISTTPSVVANVAETPVVLKFTVPAEAEYLLPFNCYITAAYLTPDFGNIEVVHENGVYKYKLKITSVGEQTINMKTNTNNASETVYINANQFDPGNVTYTNVAGVYRFSNVVFTPNLVDFGIGKTVSLKFTVPTAGTYIIYTSNLTPVSGIAVGGIYTYIATAAGEQIVNFITNKVSIAETVRITGVNYLDYTIALKNQLVQISGKLNYGILSATIVNGTITASVGTKVVSIFTTDGSGNYQSSIGVNIGDLLELKYTASNGITHRILTAITSTPQTINATLLL